MAQSLKYVHCPFNPVHSMPHKTLALHLTKCPDRKPYHKHCSFNNLHYMLESELEAHEENCSDRILMDEYLYESENIKRPVVVIENPPTAVACEESWDEPGETVNVMKTINQSSHFMKPAYGLTKSERKKHRAEMHKKYCDVDLSYNQNLSMAKRQGAKNDGDNKEKNQGTSLFIGKRP